MARIKAVEDKRQHRLAIEGDGKLGEIVLVKGGPRAYLWCGPTGGMPSVIVTGGPVLRKLAENILAEIPKK